jgi:indole-3-glycerol phosphate synthase
VILEPIVAQKRADVAARKAARPLEVVAAAGRRSERSFLAALEAPGLSLIAEIKRRSPSKGLLAPDFDVGAIAALYDRAAQAISVLTDGPFFGGELPDLGRARERARLPLLAKDFVIEPYQLYEAREHGADAVLLIARLLGADAIESCLRIARSLGMEALVEVHDAAELERVLGETSATVVGVNSRDLDTLAIDPELVHRLAPRVKAAKKILVAESGLETAEGVARLRGTADAVLIGTAFMAAPDRAAKLVELGFPPAAERAR